jgi:hypothetical protein
VTIVVMVADEAIRVRYWECRWGWIVLLGGILHCCCGSPLLGTISSRIKAMVRTY